MFMVYKKKGNIRTSIFFTVFLDTDPGRHILTTDIIFFLISRFCAIKCIERVVNKYNPCTQFELFFRQHKFTSDFEEFFVYFVEPYLHPQQRDCEIYLENLLNISLPCFLSILFSYFLVLPKYCR